MAAIQYAQRCSAFDESLKTWVHAVQKNPRSGVLLLYDEFASVGISQHWTKRTFALSAGIALNRAVYFQTCTPSPSTMRMPTCDTQYFDFDDHFSILHNASFRKPPHVDADGGVELPATADFAEHAAAHAKRRLLTMRARNVYGLAAARSKMHGASGGKLFAQSCAMFAVSRPSPSLSAIVDPIVLRGPIVALHVRTMRADVEYCLPDRTLATMEDIDAAFGNHNCVDRAWDHWRFKLKSQPPCVDHERHIADLFPLSEWFECASRAAEARNATLFVTTDSSVVERYATERHDRARYPVRTIRYGTVGHTHMRASVKNFSGTFARGAADWFVLTHADVIYSPITSTFSRSPCRVYAKCPIRIVTPSNDEACKDGCFSSCPTQCKYTSTYMGSRVRRSNHGPLLVRRAHGNVRQAPNRRWRSNATKGPSGSHHLTA